MKMMWKVMNWREKRGSSKGAWANLLRRASCGVSYGASGEGGGWRDGGGEDE